MQQEKKLENTPSIINGTIVNPLLLNAFIFYLVGFVSVVSRWITIVIYSESVGAESLPIVYTFSSILHLGIAFAISIFFSRKSVLKIIRWIYLSCFIIFIISTSLYYLESSIAFLAGILVIMGTRISSIIEMVMWICAAQFFSNQEAKKVYGTLMAANSLGFITGGLFLTLFSSLISPVIFLLISSVGLLMCGLLIYPLERRSWHQSYVLDEYSEPFVAFLKDIIKSRSWIMIMIVAIVMYICYYISDFQFIIAAQNHFKERQLLTSFFGYFEIITSSLLIVTAFFGIYIIRAYGVWYANAFAMSMILLSFFILYFSGENIYAATISKTINVVFFQLSLVAIGIICKYAKEKYQSTTIAFFDFIPVGVGTLVASFLGYLITFNVLSYSQFALMMSILSAPVLIWILRNKSTYVNVLYGTLENKELEELKENSALVGFGRNFSNLRDIKSSKLLFHDIQFKVTHLKTIKILFKLLEHIQDDDPVVRKKALVTLINYNKLKILVPYLLPCLNDEEFEVVAQAILTLYYFDEDLAKQQAPEVIAKLLVIDNVKFQILAIEIISLLALKDFSNIIIAAMDHDEEAIRKKAYYAYGTIAEIDDDKSIQILISHLNEQNSHASDALLHTIDKLVLNKKELFYDYILSSNLYIWKNTVDILMRWKCKSEYEMIILSGINKINLLYENIISINKILEIKENSFADIVAQHISVQNEVIIKGVVSITAIKAYDPFLIERIYRELRSPSKDIRGTALELIENLGEKRLTKHLIAYINANTQERIDYAGNVWHQEGEAVITTFKTLLSGNDPWIKICVIRILILMNINEGMSLLEDIATNESNMYVKSYAQDVLNNANEDKSMKAKKTEVDYLDIVVFLKKTPMFKEVHFNTIAMIAKSMIQQRFKKGASIIRAGEPVKGMYLIYQGMVTSTPLHPELQPINPLQFMPPSVIGAQYMLHDYLSLETFVANDDVVAFFFPSSLYKNVIVLHPEVALGLLSEISRYHFNMLKYIQESLNSKIT